MRTPFDSLKSPSHRCLTFAHRGGSALAPENTLLAFQNAIRMGCDVIETDAHLTADGHVVLHHDAQIDRTTNGSGPIRSFTLAELQRFDAGYRYSPDGWQHPQRGRGLRIETLATAAEALPNAYFNIEIKQQYPDMVEPLLDVLARHDLTERVLIAAANHAVMRRFRAAAPDIATSASAREALQFFASISSTNALPGPVQAGVVRTLLRPRYRALQIPREAHGLRLVTPSMLAIARRLDLDVHVWTINSQAEVDELAKLGVDGVMGDYPDRLVGALGRCAMART